MAKTTLRSADSGKMGGPLTVDDEQAQRRTNRPVERTVSQKTESETAQALATLSPTEAALADDRTLREKLIQCRDKVGAIKANRQFWEKIEYAQRLMLSGALAMAQEILGDNDHNGLPLTLSRFIGIKLPGE